jgi:5-methylthioadenosine/S-adenosylhomocysteine deaminase
MIDYLIKNTLIVTLDKQRRIIKDGTIAIEGDKIVDVGKTEELSKMHSAQTVIDAKDKIVGPGLVYAQRARGRSRPLRGTHPG